MIIITKVRKNNSEAFYSLFPFIERYLINAPDSLSSWNKVVIGVLTINIILLYYIFFTLIYN